MGNYEQLKHAVSNVIKNNGNMEITGDILQNTLLSIISTVGGNATFAGIATPTTNPGTPDQNVFYIASQPGVYTNFGGVNLIDQVLIFANTNGQWVAKNTNIPLVKTFNEVRENITNILSIYSTPYKTFNQAWIGSDGGPAQIVATARVFFYKVSAGDKINLILGGITGNISVNYYHYGFYNSDTPSSSSFMAQYSYIRKYNEDFIGQIVAPEGAVLIGISVDLNGTNDIGVIKNLNKEINDNASKIEANKAANLFPLFIGKVLYTNAILGQKYPEYYSDNSLSVASPNGVMLNNISFFSKIDNAELINDDKFGKVFRMKSSDTAYSGDVTRFVTNTILVTLNLYDDEYPFEFEAVASNGGWARINLITGGKSIQYNNLGVDIISKVGSIVTLKVYYVDETGRNLSFRLLRTDKTKSPATDYYDIISAVGYPNKNIRVHDKVLSYYSLYQSSWVNKNIMIMGDSNTPMQFVAWARHMLGTNVYSNWHAGYSMKRTTKTEKNWLYKHDRQLFIKNLIKTNGIACSAYVFFVSYNDNNGGGVLSDEAIQAVLNNYPTMDDEISEDVSSDYYKKLNGGTLSNGAEVKGWNNLTNEEVKDIFGYKQVMAAFIRQIYSLYSDREQIETPYMFLTTIMYSLAGSTDAGELAESERNKRQSINNDIYELSNWFGGIPVIDVNKGTGYALNIQSIHASDVHFSNVIKSRLGKYVCSEMLKYQMGDDLLIE